MPKYDITISGETFEVESPRPLTDAQAYNLALPSYQKLRTEQRDLESAGKAKGGEYKIGAAGFTDAAKQVADETGNVGRFMQGVGETFDRYAYGAKKLFTDLTPEEQQRLAQNKVMSDVGGKSAMAGQIGGDLAITAPLMMATGGAAASPLAARTATMLPRTMAASRSVPGRLAQVAAPNAALGALSSPEDRESGALWGAAGGLGGAAVNRAVGGVVRPFLSREGKELIEQGIQPTPGQAVGGIANKLEEKLGSLPIAGDIVGRARNRAIEEYNQALAGRVSQQVTGEMDLPAREAGRKLGATGDDALLKLRAQIGQSYEQVLEQVPQLKIERDWIERAVGEIVSDPALALSDETAKRLASYVEKTLLARGPEVSGKVAKRMESDLGKAVALHLAGTTGEQRAYGEALAKLHGAWHDGLMQTLPPQAAVALRDANAAWRAFRPIDAAAATAPSQARGGVYTPRVLRQALANADKSQSDNVLRGLREMPVESARSPYEYAAAMSRAGQALGDVVPDSGTAPRMLAGLGLGGTALIDPITTLGYTAAATVGTGALYSRMGAKLLTQGAFPATREAVGAWLAKQGIPREAIPTLTEQTLAAYSRSAKPAPRSRGDDDERLRRALVGANR